MRPPVTTTATWVQMVGVEMLMKGLSYVEEQLNLWPPKSIWLVNSQTCYVSCSLFIYVFSIG